jgi:hypothetical protein
MASLVFNPDDHSYSIGSRELPSVTQILKATGLYVSFYAKEEHRQRGEAVHHACRLICEGRYTEEGTHEIVRPFARAFSKFVSRTGYRMMGAERPMASLRLGFAGTPDNWGLVGNSMWLIDVKTGSLPAAVPVQLAAYRMLMAAQPMGDLWPASAVVSPLGLHARAVQLCDDESYNISAYDESRWESIWKSCLTVYQARKEFNLLSKENL